MNCQKAKTIQIIEYLSSLGFRPSREVNNNYWYKSMLRPGESKASFKVNIQQNCWFDHGLGEGGNILDLVMKMHGLNSVSQALKKLEGQPVPSSFSFHQFGSNSPKKRPYLIQKIDKLSNKALVNYISKTRGIKYELAQKFCSEVYYQTNQKSYFAIGFKNDLGGWELRNKFWKGCIGSKSLTTLSNGAQRCCVFEGFIDFLSFLDFFPDKEQEYDFIILNSLSKIKDALLKAHNYEKVNLFLDNDDAGEKATQEFLDSGINVFDRSYFYKPFGDVNEYLKNVRT